MWLNGEKVKNLTRIRGLTQDELAGKIGVARQTVCQWLNHKQHIAPRNLMMLAGELRCSPSDIVEDAPLFCAASRGDKFARAVISQEIGKAISNKTWEKLGSQVQAEDSSGRADCDPVSGCSLLPYSPELSAVISNIKLLAEQMTDIDMAKAVECMIKGLVHK